MYSTILLPIDDGGDADGVIDRTLEFARRFDATVHVLSVVETGAEPVGLDQQARDELRGRAEKRGRQATARVQERAAELDVETTRAVREGTPHELVLEYAENEGVDLIVMGTRTRDGPSVGLGSTTERVVARADRPVIAVRLENDTPGVDEISYDRVVIPTDGSDAAERAAERGLEFAEACGASVYVPYVVDTTSYDLEETSRSMVGLLKQGGQNAVEGVAEDARERGLSVKTDVLRGVPDEELLEYADGLEGDLIAMGTRGRGGATGDLLGSTTDRVLRRAHCPVLTVR
ncbi:UspA domain-containing protein [Natronococcus amylolyticus DSM 10524]|uniref:UspA domain-containing protein n=1 Tax=Natronococcus amylolyticus DSM 10524 TaxID=1227497 RepID=L9WYD6_9EURY|nr:universal stress protein [Natronococcus amylolyticus]ELY54427.1 UspA domain-containing protein [Natronococcus amylolyticus DSM 10524]